MGCRPRIYSREGFQPTIKGSIVYRNVRAAPHNSARSLRQDFCSDSKFRKWRNTVCISHFRNCGSGAKRRLRLADAIVRCCLRIKDTLPLQGRQDCNCTINARIPDTVRHAGVLSLPFWAGIFYRKMAPGILQIAGK